MSIRRVRYLHLFCATVVLLNMLHHIHHVAAPPQLLPDMPMSCFMCCCNATASARHANFLFMCCCFHPPPRFLLCSVYDTLSGELLQEVRRGADKAEVYSIAFNANASMLACTSDKGTVHIFKLREGVHDGAGGSTGSSAPSSSSHSHSHGHERSSGNVSRRHSGAETTSTAPAGDADGVLMSGGDVNAKSTFSFMKAVLPKYFSSEWSFAQFRVPDTRSVCAFGTEPNTIMGECSMSARSARSPTHHG